MKVLVIDGCGRKGNTWELTQCAVDAIRGKYPDTVFEELVLAKINLPLCTGCSNCFRLGHEACPHYGTMKDIIKKIDDSDGVIICILQLQRDRLHQKPLRPHVLHASQTILL